MGTQFTKEPWELEIGEDRCFHQGNRVAITVSGEDQGEPYNFTIAELWPADNDMDIKDGRLMAAAPELYKMLKEAQEHLEYCGYGDKWENECAVASKLPERIEAALTKAHQG